MPVTQPSAWHHLSQTVSLLFQVRFCWLSSGGRRDWELALGPLAVTEPNSEPPAWHPGHSGSWHADDGPAAAPMTGLWPAWGADAGPPVRLRRTAAAGVPVIMIMALPGP